MKILVIEDDKELARYISKGLLEAGHTVDQAFDGRDGLFLATTEIYDVLLIDRMLPLLDGLTLIKTIRAQANTTPILILSALGSVDERVEGLAQGCDDYLVKPFAFIELLARIDAISRRAHNNYKEQTSITVADLHIDLLSRKVTRANKAISLQSREFRLLEYLMRHKGQIITRTMLLESVWDYHFDPQTNVIDVHVSRLRGKIDKGFDTPLLKTVRGSGYMIDE
ncbi:MAG: response regulator transcription factor [Colwellia sp.]|nr:response regulator transcription factor [Colwellia sp.]